MFKNMTASQKVLAQLFTNETSDPTSKIMQYTKQVCLPKLINLAQMKDDLSSISYVCFFNAINMLQNKTYMTDNSKLFDGYMLKKKHLVDHHFPKNYSDCPGSLKNTFAQIKQDSLIPQQWKYENNNFINLYKVFCKKRMNSIKQVYTQGIEL